MTEYDRIPFAGLTGGGTTTARDTMPEWYHDRAGVELFDELPTLSTVTRRLPRAETRDLYYFDDDADEYVESAEYVALVNPEWLGDGLDECPKADAMWQPPTDTYAPVNPVDVYGPMTAVCHQRDWHDAYGQVILYRNGGEAYVEVFFPDLTARSATGDDAVFGVSTGYDHLSSTRTYAVGNAAIPERGIVLRSLNDRRARRHVGSATSDIADWWAETFDELDAATDVILNVVADAMAYDFDFATSPASPTDVYETLGFGDTQVDPIVDHYRAYVDDYPSHRHTAWALYMGVSEWLDAKFDGKESGASLSRHVSRANRLLYQTPTVETNALDTASKRLKASGTLADLRDELDEIDERKASLADARDSVLSVRERLRRVIDEADDASTESSDDDAAAASGD